MAFSILFGTLFVPSEVRAGILSSLFGGDVYAETSENTVSLPQKGDNLQNISLLQANVSSASVIQDKKNKDNNKNDEIKEDVNINIVSDNALLPTINHAEIPGVVSGDSFSDQISVYVVRKGDSISQIAEMFEVSVNTILWANDMKKGDKLKEGDVLVILPISGVKHVVTKGQTLKSIAQKYKVDISDVASFNGISSDAKLAVGDELIIPDGEIYVDGPAVVNSTPTPAKPVNTPTRNVAGYFINPVPSSVRSQGIHGKNAVDLAAPIGTPIYAAASGTVLLARRGWNGAYGNMIIIEHPNGTKTLYSHLFELNVSNGQNVSQGEVIGSVGNSGRVRSSSRSGSGAHLHFEVYGAKNPGANNSWAN